VTELLVGLREHGLDTTRPIFVGIDGAKALRAAVVRVFGLNSTRSETWSTSCPTTSPRPSPSECDAPSTPTRRWPPRQSEIDPFRIGIP
jgi:hypothetical protein